MADPSPGPSFPPPGQQPEPSSVPRSWSAPSSQPPAPQPPPPPGWAPVPPRPAVGGPPYVLGAAHKPGAVPLRPLGLTDIYDAAFRIIRFNPRATVGSAVIVAAVSMALPLVVTAVLTATSSLALGLGDDPSLSGADAAALVGTIGSFAVGTLLQWVGTLLVTGVVVHVTVAAAVGRRLTLGEALAATRGTRWRLVGLALLVALTYLLPIIIYGLLWVLVVLADVTALTIVWAVVSIPAFICLMLVLWIRLTYLPVPALMVERRGVLAAFGRGYRLTRKQFFRTLGIALLTVLLTSIASQVLTGPLAFVLGLVLTGIDPDYVLLSLVVTQALTTVISAAFVTPFTAAVTSLQYVDQRMRKEAFDVELMQQAGVTAA